MKLTSNQSGLAAVEAVLVVIVLAIIGGTGWFVYHSKQVTDKSLAASASENANPVIQKSPVTSKTTVPTAPTPQYVSYGDESKGTGIRILTAADVAKVTGAGDKLKAYLSSHLALPCSSGLLACNTPGETYAQYTVASTYGDFASTQGIDHYALLGPDPSTGEIKELISGQEGPICSDLASTIAKDKIPSGLYLQDSLFTCYPTSSSTSPIPYASYKS